MPRLDLDELMLTGKERMYGEACETLLPYLVPGVSNMERAAVLVGDLQQQVMQNGFRGWITYFCEMYAEIDLPMRVASIVEAARDQDREVADFVLDTMRLIDLAMRHGAAEPVDRLALDAVMDDAAWRVAVWEGRSHQIRGFLATATAAWDPRRNPLAAMPLDWPRAALERGEGPSPSHQGMRYPGIAVGVTSNGRHLPVVDENAIEGQGPDYLTLRAAGLWAMWIAGLPCRELVLFNEDVGSKSDDLMAEAFGRWLNPDGNGLAGVVALDAALHPDHPWEKLLGFNRAKALRTQMLICRSPEQATGLLSLVSDQVHHLVLDPSCMEPEGISGADMGFGRSLRVVSHTPLHLRMQITAALRCGATDLVVEFRDECEDEALAEQIVSSMVVRYALSGASLRFRDLLRQVYDRTQPGAPPFDTVVHNAIMQGIGYGGRVLN